MLLTSEQNGLKARMEKVGLVYPYVSGVQYDMNVAEQKVASHTGQGRWCDHNCDDILGGYRCVARRSANPGIVPASLPSVAEVVRRISVGAEGLRLARDVILRDHFDADCRRFAIPDSARDILRGALASNMVEVNLFGGEPLLYKNIMEVIRLLKANGDRVNVTTTGRRFLTDPKFFEEFLKDPPSILALSADDWELEDLKRLLEMSLDEVKREWQRVMRKSPLYGQKQKAIEAVYVAKLSLIHPFPQLLFNMVIHKGNIGTVFEIIALLEKAFPKAIVNPYPFQDALNTARTGPISFFSTEELVEFRRLVKYCIERTLTEGLFVRRLQYWLLMEAIFETWGMTEKAARAVAGEGAWTCYRGPMGSRYLQISGSEMPGNALGPPGGHNGCFWNWSTVTQNDRKIGTAEGVVEYLQSMEALARASAKPCPGCLMPRLLYDLLNILRGMHPELVPSFSRGLDRDVWSFVA